MKSRLRTGVLAGLLALAVAACGAGDDTAGTSIAAEAEASKTTGEGTDNPTGSTAVRELVLEGETVASADLFEAALAEGEVEVYTALAYDHELVWEAFTEDTGIAVSGIRLPTGDLAERINSEIAAGQLPADVITLPDRTHWTQFAEDGYLKPVDIHAADKLPSEYHNPDAPYYPIGLSVNVPAYNTELVSEEDLPSDWPDLLEPRFDGKIGFKPGGAGSGGWALSLFLRQNYGVEYLEQLAENQPVLEPSASAVVESLSRGELSVAVAIPPTTMGFQDNGAPIEMLFFPGGAPTAIVYTGRIADEYGGTNQNAAAVYVNWLVSKAGQNVIAEFVGDYPVHSEANSPQGLPPLEEVNPWVGTDDEWLNLRDEYTRDWSNIFDYGG